MHYMDKKLKQIKNVFDLLQALIISSPGWGPLVFCAISLIISRSVDEDKRDIIELLNLQQKLERQYGIEMIVDGLISDPNFTINLGFPDDDSFSCYIVTGRGEDGEATSWKYADDLALPEQINSDNECTQLLRQRVPTQLRLSFSYEVSQHMSKLPANLRPSLKSAVYGISISYNNTGWQIKPTKTFQFDLRNLPILIVGTDGKSYYAKFKPEQIFWKMDKSSDLNNFVKQYIEQVYGTEAAQYYSKSDVDLIADFMLAECKNAEMAHVDRQVIDFIQQHYQEAQETLLDQNPLIVEGSHECQ